MDSDRIIYEDCMKRLIDISNVKYALNKRLKELNKQAKEQLRILRSLEKQQTIVIDIEDFYNLF
jgi:hypothetical protein